MLIIYYKFENLIILFHVNYITISFKSNPNTWLNLIGYQMGHMSVVGIAYQNNHDLHQPEIVNLLVIGFSGTLRGWWDSYLIEESRFY